MSLSQSPAVVEWGSPSSFVRSNLIYYNDVTEILESLLLRKIWPERRLVSCRWQQTGRYTWKRTLLSINCDHIGKARWEQDVTTYSTIGGQLRLTTCLPVFVTWQKPLIVGTSYWIICPSSLVVKSRETNEKLLTK